MLKQTKKISQQLRQSFGKIKDDAFRFDLIEKYFKGKDKSNAFQTLSEKTCNDLDFNEVFMFVDRTTSKVGQQYLYQKLRTIPTASNINENLIDKLTSDPVFRTSVQLYLNKLNHENACYITSLFQEEHVKPPKWFFIIRVLSFTSLFSILLLTVNPAMIFVVFVVFLINMLIHFWNKRNLYQYVGSVPQLLRLMNVADSLFKFQVFKELNPDLSRSLESLSGIKNRMMFFRMEAKLDNDLAALVWGLVELVKIIFLIEPLFLFGVLKQLDTRRKEIDEAFSYVGEIDVLISIASLRAGLPFFCKPVIYGVPKMLSADGVYHPLIYNCIENSIEINQKSVLLTGSNMSGKTSFIRTIGINVISGLTLNTCFARSFSMPRLCVFSAIRISDDLLNDKSYYFEEVLTIKDMLDRSIGEYPNLFLLDEIFKGTNTIERISAGKAVLSALNLGKNIVFVSTHDIELADLLNEEYDLYHFSESVDYKTVDFDYKLKPGKLKTRNAIRILQLNDYPGIIIKEAIKISGDLDNNIRTS